MVQHAEVMAKIAAQVPQQSIILAVLGEPMKIGLKLLGIRMQGGNVVLKVYFESSGVGKKLGKISHERGGGACRQERSRLELFDELAHLH